MSVESQIDNPKSSDIGPRPLDEMDPQVQCIQPGGGFCMQLELAWGRLRRAYLKIFRRGYLRRMEASRQGDQNVCPHEVLDPRDVKFYRNQGGYYWNKEDDPFTWRDRLPFARVGLAELILMFGTSVIAMVALAIFFPWLAPVPAVIGILIVWFFRNPNRKIPTEPGQVVSPADGKVVAIDDIEYDEFIGGPAVSIGIFLSIFNVHINRAPVAGRVVGIHYRKGKFLNALRPESARENERLEIRMEENAAPYRGMKVRQITGAIARRIVCWSKPGDELERGEQLGMIKLGSRTELIMPQEEGLEILAQIGQNVKAGSCLLAQYTSELDQDSGASAEQQSSVPTDSNGTISAED